jgi:hypothetical protein
MPRPFPADKRSPLKGKSQNVEHNVDETRLLRETLRVIWGIRARLSNLPAAATSCIEGDFVVLESGWLSHDPCVPVHDEAFCAGNSGAIDSGAGPSPQSLHR